jgi:ribose transport system substrate-binding protein
MGGKVIVARAQRWYLAVVVVLLVVGMVCVAGCGSTSTTAAATTQSTGAATTQTTAAPTDTSATTGTTSAPAQKLTFAECSPVASNQHQMAFTYGRKQMCDLLGADFITTDANLSTTKMVSDVESFILRKVNGITSSIFDPGAATEVFKKAQDAGIPVLTSEAICDYVTTAWFPGFMCTRGAEKDAAEFISSIYPNGKILVVGGEPVPYILFVSKCMEEEAKSHNLTVLQRQDNLTDQASGAQQIVQDMLTKYKDVQAIWCFNDRSALGAAAAVTAAGLKIYNAAKPEPGAIIVTGMNGTQEALDAVRQGALTATYGGNSETIGAATIEELYGLATGQYKQDSVPKVIVTPFYRWDGVSVVNATNPLETKIVKGYYEAFVKGNDPSLGDEFLEFSKSL